MSKETITATVTTETTTDVDATYLPPEDVAKLGNVIDRALTINEEGGMAFDNKVLTEELLTEHETNWDEVNRVQNLNAAVNAALLYVGSKRSIEHTAANKDCARVAGVMSFGRNEIAYSFQSMAKETNTDGTPKNPVVSVISRQYEHESYRDIRKNVMVKARSLRD